MNSLIQRTLCGLILLASFTLSSCSDDPVTPLPKVALLSGPATIDYGTLYAGECQDTTITYNNTATFASTITSVSIDGSEVTWVGAALPRSVAAGASLDLSFRACPPATGVMQRKVVIRSATDSIVITIRGNVVPVKRTAIGALYAQPDITLPILLRVQDSVLTPELTYGQYVTAEVPIGERRIVYQTRSGIELVTSDEIDVDSANSTIAIYSGLGLDDEMILVNTPRGATPAAPLAGLRFIHASKNAPKVRLQLETAGGPSLTELVGYATSNNEFTSINTSATSVVVVDEAGATLLTIPLSVNSALQPGKLHTIVLFGNADPNATANGLTARVIVDPGQ